MAYVEAGFKTLKTGAALTRYTAVKQNASGLVIPAVAATDEVLGVVHVDAANGTNVDVRLVSAAGTFNITAGGTVAFGDPITVNASSQGITATAAAAGAVPTTRVIGNSLTAGTAGTLLEVAPAKYRI